MRIQSLFAFLLLALPAFAFAAPSEDLATLTTQLEKKPSDDALRQRLIQLAAGLTKAPVIPQEARRHFVKAVTLFKDAKNPAEIALALPEYDLALGLAPWWGDAYFNQAAAFESLGKLAQARRNLELYLLTNPKDAAAVQDRIYALEAKQDKAARKAADLDWLVGKWNLHILWPNGTPLSGPFTLSAAKEGDAVLLRNSIGHAYLRATPQGAGLTWAVWLSAFDAAAQGCSAENAWNAVPMTMTADHTNLSYDFNLPQTGGCKYAGAYRYTLTR